MKKFLLLFILLFCLVSCETSSDSVSATYSVEFVVNDTTVKTAEVPSNFTLTDEYLSNLDISSVEYWYVLVDGEEVVIVDSISINSDTVVYGYVSEEDVYLLSYVFSFDTSLNYDEECFYNQVITLEDYVFDDELYSFIGWYILVDGEEEIVSELTITSNVTIYVKYSKSTGELPWI